MAKAENAEDYIEEYPKWKNELEGLIKLLRSFSLEETIKWGVPVYTYQGKNLIGLAAFKNHYALWFYYGSDLKENTALLNNAQEGKTQNLRQIKYSKGEIPDYDLLKKYIEESIELAKQGGLKIKKDFKAAILPPEFKDFFDKDNELDMKFKNLSPGKQKEYILYITEAKREETKHSRLQKIIPMIKDGKGLNDKYKK